MANKFDTAPTATSNEYRGLNLEVEVNGEMVNLGSLFVSNKGSTTIAKRIYELIESGELNASKPLISIKNTFSSEDISENASIGASSF